MIGPLLFFAIPLLMIDFLVTGNAGYFETLIFLPLLASAYVTCWQIKSLINPSARNYIAMTDFSIATTLLLVAYMMGGAGVTFASVKLIYLQIIIFPVIKYFLIKKLDTAKGVAAQKEVRVQHA